MYEKQNIIDIYYMNEKSESITFYPVVKSGAVYKLETKEVSAEELQRFGIKETTQVMLTSKRIVLKEI